MKMLSASGGRPGTPVVIAGPVRDALPPGFVAYRIWPQPDEPPTLRHEPGVHSGPAFGVPASDRCRRGSVRGRVECRDRPRMSRSPGRSRGRGSNSRQARPGPDRGVMRTVYSRRTRDVAGTQSAGGSKVTRPVWRKPFRTVPVAAAFQATVGRRRPRPKGIPARPTSRAPAARVDRPALRAVRVSMWTAWPTARTPRSSPRVAAAVVSEVNDEVPPAGPRATFQNQETAWEDAPRLGTGRRGDGEGASRSPSVRSA